MVHGCGNTNPNVGLLHAMFYFHILQKSCLIYRNEEKLKSQLGPSIPVYECSTRSYTALDILDIVVGGACTSEKLCTKKPTGVRTTASFVIDLNEVQLKDIGADDNGSWITCNPHRTYKVEFHEGHIVAATPVQTPNSSNCYTVCRQYGTHKGTPDFRRILAYVTDKSGNTMNRALLHYYFKSGIESEIKVVSHGNARSSRPYFCTQPSTLNHETRCKFIMLENVCLTIIKMSFMILWSC